MQGSGELRKQNQTWDLSYWGSELKEGVKFRGSGNTSSWSGKYEEAERLENMWTGHILVWLKQKTGVRNAMVWTQPVSNDEPIQSPKFHGIDSLGRNIIQSQHLEVRSQVSRVEFPWLNPGGSWRRRNTHRCQIHICLFSTDRMRQACSTLPRPFQSRSWQK